MALESYPGACISCGFLSARDSSSRATGYYEVSPGDRAAGAVGHRSANTPTVIWCFVQAADLHQEVQDLGEVRPLEERTTEVIERGDRGENGCPQWMPYKEGLSPLSHYGGLAMQQQEQRQYDFQQQLEERREAWEQQAEADRRAFEERLADSAEQAERGRHGLLKWVALAALALAIAEILAAVLSAGPDSIFGRLFGV